MKTRRTAAALLAVLTALTAAGCGSSDSGSASTESKADTAQESYNEADQYDFSHDDAVSGASGDEERFGINGWFAPFIFYSTGHTIIEFDEEKQEYFNNMDDPNFERAAQLLYDIKKNDLCLNEWIGQAADCFNKNVLFYAMGPWASSADHTPKDGEDWGIVPIPQDPQAEKNSIIPGVSAYMWVAGSKKDTAMKTWLECAKIVYTDDKYKQIDKEKFFTSNPNWNEEMYDVAYNLLYTDYYNKINDPGRAVNTEISDDDAATTPSKEAVNSYMYSSVMKQDDNGVQYSRTQLKETYKPNLERGIKEINELYKNYQSGNTANLRNTASKAE